MRARWYLAAALLAGCQWDWEKFDPGPGDGGGAVEGDARACGAAGASCCAAGDACDPGLTCLSGACGTCGAGLSLCAGACVDLQSDPANCGACGATCGAAACRHGVCR